MSANKLKITRDTGYRAYALLFVLLTPTLLASCNSDNVNWDDDRWQVQVQVEPEHLRIEARIADFHGDFIHMTFRREGHDNDYSIEKSPAPKQEQRDWSRVHHWFGTMYPDTYLEGRIDNGSGKGPSSFQTFSFSLPRDAVMSRSNFDDEAGSSYQYITRGYSYADGNTYHPAFPPGNYSVEIYAWHTGSASLLHPAMDFKKAVQFIHYEYHLASSEFVIE